MPAAAAASRAAGLSSQATHLGAHGPQRLRGRQPVAAEPDHGKALPGENVGGKHHRIFSVPSPIRARITAMIQKRMTMVASCQPFFSK